VNAIVLDQVSKTYKKSWGRGAFLAVDGITLVVAEGEAFGFIGANGAGKSTTIKILTGALQASAGSASVLGRPVAEPLSRHGLGYVPENPCLPDLLTPFEILSMGVRLHRLGVDRPEAHVMGWLERFSLAHVAKKPIRTFSKGMTQRVALAHAMAVRPRLLILDEPLSGLDPIGRREVVDIVAEYNQQGGTVFFSSHVLHDVEYLADRFGLIHQGRLLTVRSPQELAAERADRFVASFQSDAAVDGASHVRAQQYQKEMPQHELPAFLQRLEVAGARLLGVRHAVSLETVFLDLVRSGGDRPDVR